MSLKSLTLFSLAKLVANATRNTAISNSFACPVMVLFCVAALDFESLYQWNYLRVLVNGTTCDLCVYDPAEKCAPLIEH